MNKLLILLTLLGMVSVAHATNPPPTEIRNVAKGGKQHQKQKQKQEQKQEQKQAQEAKAINEGVVQEIEVVNIAPKAERNTPDLGTVAAFPTANCRVAHGGSLVLPGFGGGYTSSTPDEVCQLIELSKRMEQLNRPRAAILIMCEDARVARALDDECPPAKVSVETKAEVIRP
jgi:hypothetical protein